MNIAITFRQMEATEAMRGYATEKVGKLQKFLRSPMKGHVILSTEKRTHTVELNIHAGGEHFNAHEASEDMYATIDKVIDKLERQIRESKDVNAAKRKGADRASDHLVDGVSEEE